MKVLFVTHNLLPQPTGFGSAIHMWSIIHTMVRRGNEVHLLVYDVGQYDQQTGWKTESNQHIADQLTELGVVVHVLPTKTNQASPGSSMIQSGINVLRRILHPSPVDYYAGPNYQSDLKKLMVTIQPDVLFAYTFDATSLIGDMPDVVRISSVVDLDHFARTQRLTKTSPHTAKEWFLRFVDQALLRQMPRMMVGILKKCDLVIEHANHHKNWLVSKGVQHIIYQPVMVLDYAKDILAVRPRKESNTPKSKIALIGKVNGIATLTGLRLFATEILPAMNQAYGNDAIEFHIIGGGTMPEDLQTGLQADNVIIRGYVEDIHEEFLTSDIVLVPTPIDLGFRTRIAEAFSFGCCVVAHSANAAGMPELVHDANVMLGENGNELVSQLRQCIDSPDLRDRLGKAARETFETELSGDIVSNRLTDTIESLLTDR